MTTQTHNITFVDNDTMIVCPTWTPPQFLTTKEPVSYENVSIKKDEDIQERLYHFFRENGLPYVPILLEQDDCWYRLFNMEKNTFEDFYMMPL